MNEACEGQDEEGQGEGVRGFASSRCVWAAAAAVRLFIRIPQQQNGTQGGRSAGQGDGGG